MQRGAVCCRRCGFSIMAASYAAAAAAPGFADLNMQPHCAGVPFPAGPPGVLVQRGAVLPPLWVQHSGGLMAPLPPQLSGMLLPPLCSAVTTSHLPCAYGVNKLSAARAQSWGHATVCLTCIHVLQRQSPQQQQGVRGVACGLAQGLPVQPRSSPSLSQCQDEA